MQFIIIAQDGDDDQAMTRRLAARDSHIAYSDAAVKTGEQIMAAAMLNGDDQMIGSVMIVEFESIEKVNEWLDTEAYITGDVWQNIQIIPCKVGPSFQHMLKKNHH